MLDRIYEAFHKPYLQMTGVDSLIMLICIFPFVALLFLLVYFIDKKSKWTRMP